MSRVPGRVRSCPPLLTDTDAQFGRFNLVIDHLSQQYHGVILCGCHLLSVGKLHIAHRVSEQVENGVYIQRNQYIKTSPFLTW